MKHGAVNNKFICLWIQCCSCFKPLVHWIHDQVWFGHSIQLFASYYQEAKLCLLLISSLSFDSRHNIPNNSYFNGSPSSPYNGGGGLPAQYQPSDGTNSSFNSYGLSGYGGNPALASFMTNPLGIGNMPTST
ncbi:hypothetical protein KIW84_042783 [Lathyrus oleraceus]|uniref:Nucleic acid binding NABP domain-containing protein n=1 Tax=Pisum sativum TaxID=3888 RepID=A0A9D4XDV1_PEA|nr:hypothetical protein KIW84_042783 [Pisum sativum]